MTGSGYHHMTQERSLLVIGGGAGGLSAARAAARRGAHPLLVQEGPIGGDCTFTGCVPSKTLIEAASRGATFSDAMTAVHRTVDTIAAAENDDVLEREGIEVLHGRATLLGGGRVDVDGRNFHTPRIIVATGAGPVTPPIPGLDEVDYLTNENIFDLDVLPASLAVLGGGAIGCELAHAFARLGSKVTVLEGLDRLIAKEEPEASAAIEEVFLAAGIDVRTGRKAERLERAAKKGAVVIHLDDGTIVEADRLLVSVGRSPVTAGLGTAAAGVETDERGYIRTDQHLRTTSKGVWAAGDVTGRLPFTHAADEMGRVAVANALAKVPLRRFHSEAIPWVTFTSPEVARVGVAEADAPAGSRVAFVPMTEVDRAVTAGRTTGFVKLIAGPRPVLRGAGGGRILGATIVADRAGELIHEPALAMRTRMFTGRLAQTVHAYPTWSSAVQHAAAQFFVEVQGRRARAAGESPTNGKEGTHA